MMQVQQEEDRDGIRYLGIFKNIIKIIVDLYMIAYIYSFIHSSWEKSALRQFEVFFKRTKPFGSCFN